LRSVDGISMLLCLFVDMSGHDALRWYLNCYNKLSWCVCNQNYCIVII